MRARWRAANMGLGRMAEPQAILETIESLLGEQRKRLAEA